MPSDAFAKAITRVQEAFERCPGNTRSGQPTLSKHSVNAAVGAMESLDSCSTWHCISSRSEEDVSKFMPVGEVFDNGVCLDVFEETRNLSNESYKPIRDQILQMEHLKMAYALEFLESCQIPRKHINFLRTDAIILSTPKKKMQLAKQGLVNVTRETLCKPKAWFFKRDTPLEQSAGQGQIFRVFNCELPVQEKNGILFDQKLSLIHI